MKTAALFVSLFSALTLVSAAPTPQGDATISVSPQTPGHLFNECTGSIMDFLGCATAIVGGGQTFASAPVITINDPDIPDVDGGEGMRRRDDDDLPTDCCIPLMGCKEGLPMCAYSPF